MLLFGPFSTSLLLAQDRILLRDSTEIQGKILRAGRDWVVYTAKDSMEGTTQKVSTMRVRSVYYANGQVGTYFIKDSTAVVPVKDSAVQKELSIIQLAELDASRNTSTFPGGKVAGALAFFLTPVGGLLPATAIAFTTPPKRRWTTFDSTYAHDETYVRSYRKEIRKEKQRYTLGQYKQGTAVFWAIVVLGATSWVADRLFR